MLLLGMFLGLTLLQPGAANDSYFFERRISHDELNFVIFEHPVDSSISWKINTFLQLSELNLLAEKKQKHIFEQVAFHDTAAFNRGKIFLEFKVTKNTNRVLSVKLDETASGATMYYWGAYYTFNSQNGDRVELRDIFTAKGFSTFQQMVRKKKIRSRISLVDDWDSSYREMYLQDMSYYFLEDSSIYIDTRNFLPKGIRDDSGEITRYTISEIYSLLNEYGKKIFGYGDAAIGQYRSTIFPQLLRGTIGSYPILMVLAKEDGYSGEANRAWLKGIYVYHRFGIGIRVDGTSKDQEFIMTEYNDFFDWSSDRALLTGSLKNGVISGTWKDKLKSLPVYVTTF